MRSKSSIYNLIAAMILQMINLIVGIILPRVMIIGFGSEINGLVSSIRQFITYLTLVEAGLAGACIYSLYKPLADKDINQINKILSSTKRFYNRSGIIFSIMAFILALLFPYLIETNVISEISIMVLVLILGINGSLEFFSMGKYRALLTADQKSYIISIIQAIGICLNCIIIVAMVMMGYSIISVQLVATISYILRSILFRKYVRKHYIYLNFNEKCDRKLLHQRWDVVFHQIGGMVVFNSPIAIITFFCSLVEVSIYTVYNMVFTGITGIVSIFNNGLVAGIGEIIIKGDNKTLQKVYREYECIYYMIITWIYSTAYILILPFIQVYTKTITDAQYIQQELATAFVIIGVLNTLRVPQSTIVNAAGHFKQTRYRALVEVIINLTASLILVNYFGMIGVLLGGMCSYTYRTIDFIIYVPKYITKLPIKETLVRIVKMIGLGIVIILPFKTIIYINPNSFTQWITWGCIISIWSGIIVLIGNYLTEKDNIHSTINRVRMVLGKRLNR